MAGIGEWLICGDGRFEKFYCIDNLNGYVIVDGIWEDQFVCCLTS